MCNNSGERSTCISFVCFCLFCFISFYFFIFFGGGGEGACFEQPWIHTWTKCMRCFITPRIIAIFENMYHIYSFIQLWILFEASKLSKGYSLNIKVATLYHDACVFMSYMIEAKFLRVGIFLHVGIHFNKYNLKILHYLRMLLNNIDLKWVFSNYSSVKILHILGLGIMTWPNINLLNRRMLPPNFQLFWSISFF